MVQAFQQKKITNILFFKTMIFCWFLMKIISWKVWMPERILPTIPFFEWTTQPEFSYFLFGCSMFILGGLLFLKPNRILFFLFIFIELAQLLLDQNRWQPWEYQFLLTTIFFVFYGNAVDFKKLILLLLCSTYIFSGLQKFNLGFLESNWGNLILKRIFGIQQYWKTNDFLFYFGYSIPIIETTLGILLLVLKNKKMPIIGLIVMHLFILYILSPLGVNYNEVVWPWNLMMIFYLIFFLKDTFEYQVSFSFIKNKFVGLMIVLLFILPLSNLFGYWEHYLSFGLYSGKNTNICVCFDESNETKALSSRISKTNNYGFCPNQSAIFINKWALATLKVPIYPEERVYRDFEKRFENQFPNTNFQWIYYKPDHTLKLRKQSP